MTVLDFGCRLNMVEGAVMRASLTDPRTVVINTCAVTGEAVRQARQAIRRVRRERPEARIVVTGCAAQIEPQTFAAMPEVDRVLGNVEKLDPGNYLQLPLPQAGEGRIRVNDIMSVRDTAGHMLGAFGAHARAFVEVQTGCDHRCTFCIIPYGRGNSRSVPADLVVKRIKALVDQGFNEVVLTGVDVTAYEGSLGVLVQRILADVPDLPRLRLSSIDSVEIDAALFDAITGDARLMPHLHLSLQAGDDMVLTRMKRRHRREDSLHFVAEVKARRPEVTIGADLIAGFPTESDAMFENTLRVVDDCDIVHAHIFPYSARAGTPAALMPQVPVAVRRERASRLRAASARRRSAWLAGQVGATQSVLIETRDGFGHGEGFAPVRVDGTPKRGSIVTGTVVAHIDGELRLAA